MLAIFPFESLRLPLERLRGSCRVALLLTSVFVAVAPPFAAAAPVLFVTQTPDSPDFATILSVFGNHRGNVQSATRGGGLWIRYDDGTLRNLTAEAGFGLVPRQAIAVREPCVHWDGQKALFSMVVGGTTKDDYTPVYFQIYEVTGFLQGQTVSIRKIPQIETFNNVSPIYGSDDRILFTSDRPRGGGRTNYPQLDEYESTATVAGLYSMAPDGTDLRMLDHAPSGVFRPTLDSFGRVVMTRWDHLQRDQQADSDIDDLVEGATETGYQSFTFNEEGVDGYHALRPEDEVFPEPRRNHPGGDTPDPVWDIDYRPTETGHNINLFIPWAVNEDGTDLEILNHLGRHELFGYIAPARTYLDYGSSPGRQITSFLSPVEDPTRPGYFYGIDAPEFSTHASGQVIGIYAPDGRNADDIQADYVTDVVTRSYEEDGAERPEGHVGMFRDVMVRTDGSVWAAHSTSFYVDRATATDPGSPENFPLSSRYDYAITRLVPGAGGVLVPGEKLIPEGIEGEVEYFDNARYRRVEYRGRMWELQPVEVVPRARPARRTTPIPDIELAILRDELGGDAGIQRLRDFMIEENLALIVSRDVTYRADVQQDFNLKVAWSDHASVGPPGGPPTKELAWMQIFEGRQLRGYREPERGRRVLARAVGELPNPAVEGAPPGSVRIGDDGSMAAFVPSRRALSWQTTEMDGTPVVRERYWLTFQPGEIRTCSNCHGINRTDVFGRAAPTNPPQALTTLLRDWLAGQEPPVSSLSNLSTRGFVGTDSEVMIPGFIVEGGPKLVLVSGVGPNLADFGVQGVLANPRLSLLSGQNLLASNDDWTLSPDMQAIQDTGLAPLVNLESAILRTLDPGEYTAVLDGVDSGTGVGLVQVFDLGGVGRLHNLSTRLAVGTGDRVMIAGVTVSGNAAKQVLVRGLGPTLADFGVPNALGDPEINLVAGTTTIASNDNWRQGDSASIIATGLAPPNNLEPAILATLEPGAYTAILSGVGGTSGTGLIEVYEIDEAP